uniref:hypothetical protein n=1 Tax=Saccharopolyspora galaxeae TaxID=2781241 RepID=UPI001F37C302|nr:hypothetical protein [Saccharopolyspora sp. HNM0986]
MTLEEFAAYAENFAREHGEPGTLSLRHLQRLVAGKGPKGQSLGPIRPATARLLERIFETDSSKLLSSPAQNVATPEGEAAELRERIQKARRVDVVMLQGLRDQLNSIRRIDRQYGAVVTHSELLTKIDQVHDLLTYSLSGSIRKDLAIILSEMHTLAGWQSLDMGRCTASWQHYEQAKQAALETENVAYYAHATAEQAFTLLDLGESATAVELLGSTRRSAQHRCPQLLRVWLTAAYGEALAAAGRSAESLQHFDEAERCLPHEEVNSEGPYIVLDANHLARWRGHSAVRSGRDDSIAILTSALNALDSTFSRAESALRADLATALFTLGENRSASEELSQSRRIARRIGSARQMKRLQIVTELDSSRC